MRTPDLFSHTSEIETPTGPSGMSDDLLKEVLVRKATLIDKMVSGNCKTMESYADAVGGYRQLEFVLGHATRKSQAAQDALGPIVDDDAEPLEELISF